MEFIIPLEEHLTGKETRKIIKQYEIDNIHSTLFFNDVIYRIQKKGKGYVITEFEGGD